MFVKLFGSLRWGEGFKEGREQKFKKLWFITWLYLVPWLTREMWQNDPSVSSEKRSWFGYEYNTDGDSVVSVCVEGCDSIGAVLYLQRSVSIFSVRDAQVIWYYQTLTSRLTHLWDEDLSPERDHTCCVRTVISVDWVTSPQPRLLY